VLDSFFLPPAEPAAAGTGGATYGEADDAPQPMPPRPCGPLAALPFVLGMCC
jgi:hypothetical protein